MFTEHLLQAFELLALLKVLMLHFVQSGVTGGLLNIPGTQSVQLLF